MLCKTDGIVITSLKYGETSLIARIFTRALGMQSYLARGARKARSRNKQQLFQPLTLVSMVAYHKGGEGLQHIKEICFGQPLHSIPSDIRKTTIALFLSEVFHHALKNQEANEELFDQMVEWIAHLDRTERGLSIFHIAFLLRVSKYLGFQPRDNHDAQHCYFNLQEGVYERHYGNAQAHLDKPLSESFLRLSKATLATVDSLIIPREHKTELLRKVAEYYRHHIAGMPALHSLTVLETVFGDM